MPDRSITAYCPSCDRIVVPVSPRRGAQNVGPCVWCDTQTIPEKPSKPQRGAVDPFVVWSASQCTQLTLPFARLEGA